MAICLKNISKSFHEHLVISHLNLSFEDGLIHTFLGPSGCGKTTLLNIINGSIIPDEGSCDLAGHNISQVFQEPCLLPWKTVRENIQYVTLQHLSSKQETIEALMKDVGLIAAADKYPHELSGGMQQRCALARAFTYDASCVLLDEPFKGLDEKTKSQMISLVFRLWKKHEKTIIFITHSVEEALMMSNTITLLSAPPAQVVFQRNIETDISERAHSPQLKALKEELSTHIHA